jgi:hypothetical protein
VRERVKERETERYIKCAKCMIRKLRTVELGAVHHVTCSLEERTEMLRREIIVIPAGSSGSGVGWCAVTTTMRQKSDSTLEQTEAQSDAVVTRMP